ncbi:MULTISPECIES: hypothetical protein [unclassified Micromonospora]|uniref:hypothetical protein n=1 Tax=unclassified Micromonospora TaxID=2617518 RepID=UPI001C2468D8|nr:MULTISPECIES: hypothetical protein [unclassified Micromonospora]MBU8857752.1 hypothetical protein [Micromonospora sp. WMMB482]MDM4783379.1 hypothetical protein [Micromonospora sp. b486]
MTQTSLTRSKRAELEALQFDKEACTVGPYPVTNLSDAYTSRSTPESQIRADYFMTVTVDIGEPGAPRTIDLQACDRCNRVFGTVRGVESHLARDHSNGNRLASAGSAAAAPTSGEPEPEGVQAQASNPGDATGAAFMSRARETRAAYDKLVRAAKRRGEKKPTAEAAAATLGISRVTLSRRLKATGFKIQKRNRETPEMTRDAFCELRRAEPTIGLTDAAARLNMRPETLLKRLRVCGLDPDNPPPADEPPAVASPLTLAAAAVPPATFTPPPTPAADTDDHEDEQEPPISDAIDPTREHRIDTYLGLVEELSASRGKWQRRAETAIRERDEAYRERDKATAALDTIRKALGSASPAD